LPHLAPKTVASARALRVPALRDLGSGA